MTARTRHAHIRATDASGHEWKLSWCPETSTLTGRPLYARTSYTMSGAVLLEALAQGTQVGAIPREDPRQLSFIHEIPS